MKTITSAIGYAMSNAMKPPPGKRRPVTHAQAETWSAVLSDSRIVLSNGGYTASLQNTPPAPTGNAVSIFQRIIGADASGRFAFSISSTAPNGDADFGLCIGVHNAGETPMLIIGGGYQTDSVTYYMYVDSRDIHNTYVWADTDNSTFADREAGINPRATFNDLDVYLGEPLNAIAILSSDGVTPATATVNLLHSSGSFYGFGDVNAPIVY